MRIKGLLKTYLTEDESKHNIHHYWKIFSVDPEAKKTLIKTIILESKNLEQVLVNGKAKVKSSTLEYIMKLVDNLVISIPEVIIQATEMLKEFNLFDETVDYGTRMLEELFKLIIIKWDCLQEIVESMDVINGNENELAMKVKLRTIAGVLKAFRFAKRSASKG
eukprot:TRINITY_DN11180_c0_g2_i6.p1 TRINITY_DN11180_c0_g2~~TRINITY_DN11180_c0_g2_i6.p1  ORF type:complete len:164 (+),score=50.29 TRINITY_DN11180_c0_g2_i6:260-751(+)